MTDPCTILVVDDESVVREAVCDILRDHGYVVLQAEDPEAALVLARRHRGSVDLLITDVVMRYMSGRELAMRLSADRPRLRTIYMSGFDYDNIGHLGVMRPETPFLNKPFSPEELLTTVRRVLTET